MRPIDRGAGWLRRLFLDEPKRTLYRVMGVGLRIYVACLFGTAVYSFVWLAEITGTLEETTLAAIWLAMAAMGAAFLVLLVPLYHTSRYE